jgi:NADH dehydrogenase
MAEIARRAMPSDFRSIDTTTSRILLLEGFDRVLPTYPADLSEKARRQLERLGVEVRTGALVSEIGADYIVAGGERIGAETVFWAAGVSASPLGSTLGVETDRSGRVPVEPDCSVRGHPNLFVIGDLATVDRENGQPVPGVAQGAIQMGKHAARQIRRDLEGQPRRNFHFTDKGDLATIGRAAAVARLAGMKLSGFVAWLIWVTVHITYLIGFRNRILVMVQWAWAYVSYQRGIRLITGNPHVDIQRPRNAEDRLPRA